MSSRDLIHDLFQIHPASLARDEVDPRRHRYDPATAGRIVAAPPLVGRKASWAGKHVWLIGITHALMVEYGAWACGFLWGPRSEHRGGPVRSWCCIDHSVTTTARTQPRVVAALTEWRAWIERLDTLFAELARLGIVEPAPELVSSAIGGRFESWIAPTPELIEDVAARLANGPDVA